MKEVTIWSAHQGTMSLGKNEQKRKNAKLGKTGNPKKTYTH